MDAGAARADPGHGGGARRRRVHRVADGRARGRRCARRGGRGRRRRPAGRAGADRHAGQGPRPVRARQPGGAVRPAQARDHRRGGGVGEVRRAAGVDRRLPRRSSATRPTATPGCPAGARRAPRRCSPASADSRTSPTTAGCGTCPACAAPAKLAATLAEHRDLALLFRRIATVEHRPRRRHGRRVGVARADGGLRRRWPKRARRARASRTERLAPGANARR